MGQVTRAVQVEVAFHGWRKHDLRREEQVKVKDGVKKARLVGLWPDLWNASRELSRAANKLMLALYMVKTGMLPLPVGSEGKPSPFQSLAYKGLTGSWKPFEEPIYKPAGRRLGSGVVNGCAQAVYTRLTEDLEKMRKGTLSVSSFRKVLPFTVQNTCWTLDEHCHISMPIWEVQPGNGSNHRITLAPVGLDKSQRTVLARILDGTYKRGDLKLFWSDRKHKWMCVASWTGEVQDRPEGLVAGIDLRFKPHVTAAYLDGDGKPQHVRDSIQIPGNVIRAWERVQAERRQRSTYNRRILELREGRGVARKVRVVEAFSEKQRRIADTAVKQLAAAVVKAAVRRGASTLVVEKLTGFADNKMTETEVLVGKARAKARTQFLKWHQGAIREALKSAGPLAGFTVVEVEPAWTSRTCHKCGKVWLDPGTKAPGGAEAGVVAEAATGTGAKAKAKAKASKRKVPKPNGQVFGFCDGKYGLLPGRAFRCDCGLDEWAPRNAAVNIGRAGIKKLADNAAAAAAAETPSSVPPGPPSASPTDTSTAPP